MGNCILTVDQTKILVSKSVTNHADNDWINLVVSVNDTVAVNQTMPLNNPKFAGQSEENIFGGGDIAAPWGITVPCSNQDSVVVYYSIINLSSNSWSDQATAAAQFTQKVVDAIVPIYLKAASLVLGALSDGLLPASEAIAGLASGGVDLINAFSSAIEGLIDQAFQDVLTPALDEIANFFQNIVGTANCNGLILRDYVIFGPGSPVTPVHIAKTYTGPQNNSSCRAPQTSLDIVMTRQLDPVPPTPQPSARIGSLRPGSEYAHKIA